MVVAGDSVFIPALLMRTSRWSNSEETDLYKFSISFIFSTSACFNMIFKFCSFNFLKIASPASLFLHTIITVAPIFANFSVIPRPKPRLAPVIKTILFFILHHPLMKIFIIYNKKMNKIK